VGRELLPGKGSARGPDNIDGPPKGGSHDLQVTTLAVCGHEPSHRPGRNHHTNDMAGLDRLRASVRLLAVVVIVIRELIELVRAIAGI
jgi:hypothetical protein